MDPLSIASGIVGLASLIGSLVPLISAVKHASDDAHSLIEELQALQLNLSRLHNFLTSRTLRTVDFKDSSLLISHTKALTAKLTELRRNLERTSRSSLRQLAWPLRKRDCQDQIAQIRAFSQLIHFALSIDASELLSSTSDAVIDKLNQQMQDLKLLGSISDQIAPLEGAIQKQTDFLESLHQTELRTDILSWLSDDSQEKHHSWIRMSRTSGTGEWFLNRAEFRHWTRSSLEPNALWCPGEMGSGKSTLCSLVIDHLSIRNEEGKSALAFFYFSHAKNDAQTFRHFLGSLVRQLMESSGCSIPQSLLQLHNKHGGGTLLLQEELLKVFLQTVHEIPNVYLVFDAIDEIGASETLQAFLDLLVDLKANPNVRTLVTGRPHRQDFQPSFKSWLSINISATEADIRLFIDSGTKTSSSGYLLDDNLRAEISNRLVQSAQGLFLLPALQLRRLLQEPTRGDLEDALRDLPCVLSTALKREMTQILNEPLSRKKIALDSLMWLCQARRPMSADELSDVLSLDFSQKRWLSKKYRPTIKTILECCQGLVQYDRITNTYHLVHLAVQEYLIAHQWDFFGQPVSILVAQACLLYILDAAFEHGPGKASGCLLTEYPWLSEEAADEELLDEGSNLEVLQFLERHAFFGYVSQNWGSHVQEYAEDSKVRKSLMKVLDSEDRVARLYQVEHYLRGYRWIYWSSSEAWSAGPVLLASSFGLTAVVRTLLDTRQEHIDHATSIGTTALMVAASNNHLELVQELLKRGADPLISNWYGNALHCAAEANCPLTVKEVLAIGVSPNIISPLGRTALSCSLDQECVEAAEVLLQYNASTYYEEVRPHGGVMVNIKILQPLKELQCLFLVEIMETRAVRMLSMVIYGGYLADEDKPYARKVIDGFVETNDLTEGEAQSLISRLSV